MNTLKTRRTELKINNPETGEKEIYKGYPVGDIPKRFGFDYNENNEQSGITEWFNYKGLTFINTKHI